MPSKNKRQPKSADDAERPKTRNRPGSRGPVPYAPSEQDKRTARTMAAYGVRVPDIAASLGISADVLRRTLGAEMAAGRAQASAAVGQRFYALCVGSPAEYDARGNLTRAEVLPDIKSIHLFVQRRLDFASSGPVDDLPENANTIPGFENADLSRLSNDELQQLAELAQKAAGAAPRSADVDGADPARAGATRH